MRVKASIDEVLLENGNGREIQSTQATCSRCGHETQSFGISDNSIKRCLALLNDECPNGENNFYIEEECGQSKTSFEDEGEENEANFEDQIETPFLW